jgi:hypothetical protein
MIGTKLARPPASPRRGGCRGKAGAAAPGSPCSAPGPTCGRSPARRFPPEPSA